MFLLIDVDSVGAHPGVQHLLSFDSVAGLKVERHVSFVERPGSESFAVIGAKGTQRISMAPLNQFKRFAVEIAARPGCPVQTDVVARALALSFLAKHLGADAVVSSARPAFGPKDQGLLDVARLVTVPEALAMIGAHVRQRDQVPLSGSPPLFAARTEVYPLTAQAIIPHFHEWWASCVQVSGLQRQEMLGHAGAVSKRIGQALRGRDGVHEAFRIGGGRSAVLEALYHFDVVLTSGVGGLDALARVAHDVFGTTAKPMHVAWQREGWRTELHKLAPAVADIVAPGTKLGAALRILTTTRNSIHSIPLDEYLYVEAGSHTSRVEHRIMVSSELASRINDVGSPLAPLESHGIFINDKVSPFLNLAQYTETLLAWIVEIVGTLIRSMLSYSQFPGVSLAPLGPLEQLEVEFCAALARVGSYPCRTGAMGVPAAPSIHRTVMASINKQRSSHE